MVSDLISLFNSLFVSRETNFEFIYHENYIANMSKQIWYSLSLSFSPLVDVSSSPLVVLFGVRFEYFGIGIAYLPFMVRLVESESAKQGG